MAKAASATSCSSDRALRHSSWLKVQTHSDIIILVASTVQRTPHSLEHSCQSAALFLTGKCEEHAARAAAHVTEGTDQPLQPIAMLPAPFAKDVTCSMSTVHAWHVYAIQSGSVKSNEHQTHRTHALAEVSMPVPCSSASPMEAWQSPMDSRAPCTSTGR